MKPHYEKIIPDAGQSFRAFYFDVALPSKGLYTPYHIHPELEIGITFNGVGKRLIGDNLSNYGPTDLVLIGSNLPHSFTSEKLARNQGMVIQFKRNFMGDNFLSLSESKSLNDLFNRASRGLVFDKKIIQEIIPIVYELKNNEGLYRITALMKILCILCRSEGQTLASANYTAPSTTQEQQKRIEAAIQYMLKNFASPLSLEAICNHCNMSRSAFSRLFNKSVGKNYKAFLIDVRIGHACRLLSETDLSVLEIALASGFANLSNFNRRFLEHVKMKPKDYRKQTEQSLND